MKTNQPKIKTSIKATISASMPQAIALATRALEKEGFGVLTTIDLQQKFQQKLSITISPAVILGACAPAMAHEAYQLNPDVAGLLPCNVVVRELEPNQVSIEIALPSAVLGILHDARLSALAREADQKLERVAGLIKKASDYREHLALSDSELERDIEEECWNPDFRWGLTPETKKNGNLKQVY